MNRRSVARKLALAGLLVLGPAGAQVPRAGHHGWKPGQDFAECGLVSVVDGRGRPVRDAEVTLWLSEHHGQRWQTDERGRICERELLYGGSLSVAAPALVGGDCAGTTRIDLPPFQPSSGKPPETRVTLDVKAVPKSGWSGRVVGEDGRPIAGALVRLQSVEWARDDGSECMVAPSADRQSAKNGRFWFERVPRGRASFEVSHRDFAERTFDVTLPGPSRDIVLSRGGSWTGQVLDPHGTPLGACQIWLETRFGNFETSHCTASGFALHTLPAGPAKLKILVRDHPVLGTRYLERRVTVDAGVQRREDVSWPAGASISGQLVTSSGQPIAGVKLSAFPKGVEPTLNRLGPQEVVTRTDADGRFRFLHLGQGTWVLRGHAPSPVVHEVAAGTSNERVVVR